MPYSSTWTDFFNRPLPNMALRIFVMLVGLTTVAFGIALSRSTGMGTSVISCIPAVLSFTFTDISMGTFTFAFNVLLLAISIALLRRRFKPLQILCIPFVFVFSAIIDFFVPVTEAIPMPNYLVCLLFSVLSCAFIALGVWLQIKAKLVLLPGESVVLAFSTVLGIPFPKMKIINDSTMMALGTVMSFAFMGGLFGVREGTVIAAVLVGYIIKLINKAVPDFEPICPTVGHPTLTPDQ